VAVWLTIVVVGVAWPHVRRLPPAAGISAAPFYGRWAWTGTWWTVLAVVVGVAAVAVLPTAFERLDGRRLAVVSGAVATVWTTVLALSGGGFARVAAPISSRYEYLPYAASIDIDGYLGRYVDQLATSPTHVKGHPPGLVVLFWAMDRIGLAGRGWAAFAVLVLWGLGVAAVVHTVRVVGGLGVARVAAPFVALSPAAVWAGTSGDAAIAGVTAGAIALLVHAAFGDRRMLVAALGGAAAGLSLHLSYGVAPLLLVPVVVALRRRRPDVLAWAAVGGGAVTAAFVAAGFWWYDGLSATRGFYAEGLASIRPYSYFVVGNLAASALAIGPVAGAGLGEAVAAVRRRVDVTVVVVVLAAVLVADLSGLSKGEVERIWLPFTLWLSSAAAWFVVGSRASVVRGALAAHLVLALFLQSWLVTPW